MVVPFQLPLGSLAIAFVPLHSFAIAFVPLGLFMIAFVPHNRISVRWRFTIRDRVRPIWLIRDCVPDPPRFVCDRVCPTQFGSCSRSPLVHSGTCLSHSRALDCDKNGNICDRFLRMCELKFYVGALVLVHGLNCSKASALYSAHCQPQHIVEGERFH